MEEETVKTLVAVAILLLSTVIAESTQVTYVAQDLGTLDGTVTTWAYDINNSGDVVGMAETADGYTRYPVILQNGKGWKRIADLKGRHAGAYAINDSGQVVCDADDWTFLWNTTDQIKDYGWGAVTDISSDGWVVGGKNFSSPPHACLWDLDGKPMDLGTLPGYRQSIAFGINDHHVVVGESGSQFFYSKAFLWTAESKMIELRGLSWRPSRARDINNRGQVVGISYVNNLYSPHACLWNPDGIPVDLGVLQDQRIIYSSYAQAINNCGTIVGASGWVPVYWDGATHTLTRLPLLPDAVGGEAIGINDNNQIVGYCDFFSDNEWYSHAILWTPLPLQAKIDIKPGEYPNTINLHSRGVVPVAVLTTPEFDAATIDPLMVRFSSAEPLRWRIENVDSDRDADLLLYFDIQSLDLTAESTEGTLTGRTTEWDQIIGADSVHIVGINK